MVPDNDIGGWPRSRWVNGDGVTVCKAGGCALVQYVIHTQVPRFFARVVDESDEGARRPEAGISGVTHSDRGLMLCEVVWTDDPPRGRAMNALLAQAVEAVDSILDTMDRDLEDGD